jgi:hypothetical protein
MVHCQQYNSSAVTGQTDQDLCDATHGAREEIFGQSSKAIAGVDLFWSGHVSVVCLFYSLE